MNRRRLDAALGALLVLGVATICRADDWRQFRGNDGRSVAESAQLPITWKRADPATGEPGVNVTWETALPGRGVSSPIVVGGKVIVTAASGPKEDQLHVLCFDAATGELDWERQFWATGRTLFHHTSSVAANTPASDGRRIFAFFSSNDLVCLDLEGNLKWLRGLAYEYPTAANDVGMASSPLVIGDIVIVQVETKGKSFAAGLDAATGVTRWQIPRTVDMNWTSPAVWSGAARESDRVLLQSPDGISAHDPATGQQVWMFKKECSSIPSPVAMKDVAFVPTKGLTALRAVPGSAEPEVLWDSNQLSPGNASPIVHDGRVITLARSGAITCGDTATGKTLWRARIKGTFWSTPVLAGHWLYTFNQDGECQVLDVDQKGELVAENFLGERVMGSPAVVDDALYVRGDHHLWRISEP